MFGHSQEQNEKFLIFSRDKCVSGRELTVKLLQRLGFLPAVYQRTHH